MSRDRPETRKIQTHKRNEGKEISSNQERDKVQIDYWDKLGEAITETIREYQGWKIHRESLRAATVLVSFVVDQLRFGEILNTETNKCVFTGYSRGLHVQGSRETKEEEDDD